MIMKPTTTNDRYFMNRQYHPDEIGGYHRFLTGEEVDAWRAWLCGSAMTRRQTFVVQQLVADKMKPQPTGPHDTICLPPPVNVTVNVNDTGRRRSSSDGTLFVLSVFLLIVVVIAAVVVMWSFFSWFLDHGPWSFCILVFPVLAALIITRQTNSLYNESDLV